MIVDLKNVLFLDFVVVAFCNIKFVSFFIPLALKISHHKLYSEHKNASNIWYRLICIDNKISAVKITVT